MASFMPSGSDPIDFKRSVNLLANLLRRCHRPPDISFLQIVVKKYQSIVNLITEVIE
jgi:hypothetical protein